MTMKTAGLMAATLLVALHGAPAVADPPTTGYQLGLSLDTFPDRWSLPPRHEDPLVTLPTSRMTLNAHLDNFFRPDEGFLFGVDGRFHWRDRADYPEPGMAGVSEYQYHGMDLQALGGYRFGAPGDAVRYDMRMGLGYRGAGREQRLSGAYMDDDTGVFYTQFSGGPRFATGSWRGFLEMGVRVPLTPDERSVALGEGTESVGNGRRSAGFVSFQNLFQLSDSSALRLDLYYDSYRFGPAEGSRWHALGGDDRSIGRDSDVFGFEMGLNF
jgi:hypothetical protein